MSVAGLPFLWLKKGRIFTPDGRYEWMQTHAQNPAVLVLEDRLRVYFNCRPKRSSDGSVTALPTFVDLDKTDPSRILAVHDRPLLPLGEPGTFDEFGAMAATVIRHEGRVLLYYVGWNRCVGVPYNHAIGLAVSHDDGTTFSRFGEGPVITRTFNEPFIQNSPFVMSVDGVLHMWYSTGLRWIEHEGNMESVYVIVHATSNDGVRWERNGVPSLAALVEYECQTNPSVIKIGERYHMWFCYRCGLDFRNAERGYRIGYAWSDDLQTWHRNDAFGELLPSKDEGWDSQMICYPCVVEVNENVYMFYSGNDFGMTGFGYAVLHDGQR